ncbi:hypothetical protein [Streptomyces sp. NBC_01190]|uniref:hypothetical protein n=1 Tax=Streptomyces sp. NBC_01190 TaxID=2903767 RepID=UPI003865A2F5|nr:hypothetical protein OG519_18260 [Streptomyces sp. NBC_01190]
MSARDVVRALRPSKPRQAVGDPCEDCGAVLVLCVQCGTDSRCPDCYPYERPTRRDEEVDDSVRLARDHPHVGLLGGAIAALIPAAFDWVDLTYVPPGVLRIVTCLAGAAACCLLLAAGAAWRALPLLGEVPHCRRGDLTPHDRRALAGCAVLVVQIVLVCVGVTAA